MEVIPRVEHCRHTGALSSPRYSRVAIFSACRQPERVKGRGFIAEHDDRDSNRYADDNGCEKARGRRTSQGALLETALERLTLVIY